MHGRQVTDSIRATPRTPTVRGLPAATRISRSISIVSCSKRASDGEGGFQPPENVVEIACRRLKKRRSSTTQQRSNSPFERFEGKRFFEIIRAGAKGRGVRAAGHQQA